MLYECPVRLTAMNHALDLRAELIIRTLMTKFRINREQALELYLKQRQELIDSL